MTANERMRDNIRAVLFDLDGTLLPMEMEEFTNTYFGLLAKKAAPYGFEPKALVEAVWTGTRAMMKNDGSMTNCDRFWKVFAGEMGEDKLQYRPVFDDFYAHEFSQAVSATQPTPLAKKAVESLKSRGIETVLATNPLFPRIAVENRLGWLGLSGEDFSFITTYENSSYCKPSPGYFEEILRATGRKAEECLMVGNDTREDLAARDVGMAVYLLTDCLIDPGHTDLTEVPHGRFPELLTYLGAEA